MARMARMGMKIISPTNFIETPNAKKNKSEFDKVYFEYLVGY